MGTIGSSASGKEYGSGKARLSRRMWLVDALQDGIAEFISVRDRSGEEM